MCVCVFIYTGSLEVFHAVMLKYTEKRLHFGYDSMRARTQLAVLDHNSNVGRPLATTQQGMIEDNVLDSILIDDQIIFGHFWDREIYMCSTG